MRRVIAAVLLAAMLVSATNLSVFAETSSKAATQAVGSLTAAIRLDYPELLNNVEQRNFKLQLKEGQQLCAEISLSKETSTETIFVDGKEVTVLVSLRNEQDVDLTTDTSEGSSNLTVINKVGKKLPVTGSSMMLLMLTAGTALVTGAFVYGKRQKKSNDEN